jgi:pimeloyl-ACP methyl ester carboxylesterase
MATGRASKIHAAARVPAQWGLLSLFLGLTGCATASTGEYTRRWTRPDEVSAVALPDGFTLRTVTRGDGPPLVLMHTIRTQLDYFEALVPSLAVHYRVYVVDLPGHGQSTILPREYTEPLMREAISELLVKLDLHEVTLVGESIGGVLALTVSAEHSDRVSRVVSINPYDYGDDFGGGIRNGGASWIIWLFHLFGGVETEDLLAAVLKSGFHNPSLLSEQVIKEYYRTGLRSGYRRMEYSLFDNWRSWVDARNVYSKITVPVTLVYGDDDWSTPADRESTRSLLRTANVVSIVRAGHFASLEQPDAIAQAISGALPASGEQQKGR